VGYETANDEDARPLTPVIESSGYEKDGPSYDFLLGGVGGIRSEMTINDCLSGSGDG
jgi:hypothetical protein